MDAPFFLWVYLSTTPLLWLALTVVIWILADWLALLSGRNPLVNPVMIAIAAISAILLATGTSYGTYFDGAQFIHFLLGPTTVAIALPLYKLADRPAQDAADAGGPGCGNRDVDRLGHCRGGSTWRAPRRGDFARPQVGHRRRRHGDPKDLGGVPALTAVLVVFTGVLGAVIVTP